MRARGWDTSIVVRVASVHSSSASRSCDADMAIAMLSRLSPDSLTSCHSPRRFHRGDDLLGQPLDRLLLRRGDGLAGFGNQVRRLADGDQLGRHGNRLHGHDRQPAAVEPGDFGPQLGFRNARVVERVFDERAPRVGQQAGREDAVGIRRARRLCTAS